MTAKYSRPLKQGTMMVYCLLLLAGCTTSYALLDSIRPAYRVSGEATQTNSMNSYEQGKQLFSEGKYGLALDAFKQANAQNPDSVNALNGIAACYDQIKRHDLAASYYYKALKIQPDSVKTLNNLGYSYLMQGRYSDAKKVLQIALAHDPDNKRIAHNLGMADVQLAKQNATEDSVSSLSKVAETEVSLAPEPKESAVKTPETTPEKAEVVANPVSEVTATPKLVEKPMKTIAAEVTPEPVANEAATEPIQITTRQTDSENADTAVEKVTEADQPVVTVQKSESPALQETAVTTSASEPAKTSVSEVKVAPLQVAHSEPVLANKLLDPLTIDPVALEPDSTPVVTPEETAAALAEVQEVATPKIPNPAKSVASAAPEQQPMKVVVLSVGNRIEISNGNGRTGMAKALSNFLKSRNEWVWKISNSLPFNQEKTTLYYLSGKQIEAEQLAIKVPAPVVLKETAHNRNNSDLRLVIGHDFVYSNESEIHMMARIQEKASQFSVQFSNVISPARLEVANGNGRDGMARLVTTVLARHGQTIRRVTNADNFDYFSSVIYYMPSRKADAEKVAAMLPVKAELKEMDISHRNVDIRIVIGKDLLEAEEFLSHISTIGHV